MSKAARREVAVYVALLVVCILLVAFSNSAPLLELRKGVGFALSPIQDTLRQGTWARSVPLGSNTSRLISTQDGLAVSWPARLRRQRACK